MQVCILSPLSISNCPPHLITVATLPDIHIADVFCGREEIHWSDHRQRSLSCRRVGLQRLTWSAFTVTHHIVHRHRCTHYDAHCCHMCTAI